MNTSANPEITKHWKMVYGHLRSLNRPHHEAEDLTQALFLNLIEHEQMHRIDSRMETEESIRNFLFLAARNVLRSHLRGQKALKRGGGVEHLSIERDAEQAEPPLSKVSPAEEVAQREVQTLWRNQIAVQFERAKRNGKANLFAFVRPALDANDARFDAKGTAEKLGMNPATVRVQAHRWRPPLWRACAALWLRAPTMIFALRRSSFSGTSEASQK